MGMMEITTEVKESYMLMQLSELRLGIKNFHV